MAALVPNADQTKAWCIRMVASHAIRVDIRNVVKRIVIGFEDKTGVHYLDSCFILKPFFMIVEGLPVAEITNSFGNDQKNLQIIFLKIINSRLMLVYGISQKY